MIKILWKIGLPGSGKTIVGRHTQELLLARGYNAVFIDDKLPLDRAAWEDVSRFLHDPSRRTPDGGVKGEHSWVHNPDAGVGRLRIDFYDGKALNLGHEMYFLELQDFVRRAGPKDIMVAECTPGVDDYSYGDGKEPVIQNPAWLRQQIISHGLLDYSLIEEIKASDAERLKRNNERTSYNIPEDLLKRIFPNNGGQFAFMDRWAFSGRYWQVTNNGRDEFSFLKQVDQRFSTIFEPRIIMEGNARSPEREMV